MFTTEFRLYSSGRLEKCMFSTTVALRYVIESKTRAVALISFVKGDVFSRPVSTRCQDRNAKRSHIFSSERAVQLRVSRIVFLIAFPNVHSISKLNVELI